MASYYYEPVWDISSDNTIVDNSTEHRDDIITYTTSSAKDQDSLEINVHATQNFLHMAELDLEVQFTLQYDVGGGYRDVTYNDGIAMQSAWSMFDQVVIKLNDGQIAQVANPDTLHHMSSLVQYSPDYLKSIGSAQGYYPPLAGEGRGGLLELPDDLIPDAVAFLNADGNALAADEYFWVPQNDPASPVQSLFKSGADLAADAAVFTGRTRPNPDYDESFNKSIRWLGEGGTHTVRLPLFEIFPFLRQIFTKVQIGSRIDIQLVKNKRLEKIFWSPYANAPDLKLEMTRVGLWTPHLVPNEKTKAELFAVISTDPAFTRTFDHYNVIPRPNLTAQQMSGGVIRLTQESSRILRVYVSFRFSDRITAFNHSPLTFDDVGLQTLDLQLNGTSYPTRPYTVGTELSRSLHDTHRCSMKQEDYEDSSLITRETFKQGCHRIYCFDLTATQNHAFKARNVSDLELRFESNTGAYAGRTVDLNVLVVTERELKVKLLNGVNTITIK